MGETRKFLSFYMKISPKLAKILKLSSKFWHITLKNVKMLLKN